MYMGTVQCKCCDEKAGSKEVLRKYRRVPETTQSASGTAQVEGRRRSSQRRSSSQSTAPGASPLAHTKHGFSTGRAHGGSSFRPSETSRHRTSDTSQHKNADLPSVNTLVSSKHSRGKSDTRHGDIEDGGSPSRRHSPPSRNPSGRISRQQTLTKNERRRSDKKTARLVVSSSSEDSDTTPTLPAAVDEIKPTLSTSSSEVAAENSPAIRVPISIDIPADQWGPGVYLQYSSINSGVMSILWSKEYPQKGVNLAFAKPKKNVPNFKYHGTGRRQDLVTQINSTKGAYFAGWLAFFKLAHSVQSEFYYLPGINQTLPVKILLLSVRNLISLYSFCSPCAFASLRTCTPTQ